MTEVMEFMAKHDLIKPVRLGEFDEKLALMAGAMQTFAATLGQYPEDPRRLRAHHMVEELAETLDAMAIGDEVEFADGLTDLVYVVVGTAVKFGLPLHRLWDEVHRSNMTKTFDGGNHPKGEGYTPPRIREVLDARV
jgi:predicted HAD superfamily Cof-like phosphohydrolase